MKSSNVISEEHLLEYARCPLRLQASVRSPEMTAGIQTLKWLLAQEFSGHRPTLATLREQFEHRLQVKSRRAFVAIPGMCRKLRDLLDLHPVMQPMTNYLLSYGATEITGQYAVLLSGKTPMILRLHTGQVYREPDLLVLARWAHFHRFEPSYRNVGAICYSLSDGSYLRTSVKESMQVYLESAVHAYMRTVREQEAYPVPGPHCDTCKSLACMKGVIRG